MMHRVWSSIVEVPYCFSRSYLKVQGHTALKIVEFDPNWAFLDYNSSLNSPMAMKCCTKLETAKGRCPIIFQGHPSNFKVTRYKTSPIFTQIGRFRTIGRSQLSNPSDLPCSVLGNILLNQAVKIQSIPQPVCMSRNSDCRFSAFCNNYQKMCFQDTCNYFQSTKRLSEILHIITTISVVLLFLLGFHTDLGWGLLKPRSLIFP